MPFRFWFAALLSAVILLILLRPEAEVIRSPVATTAAPAASVHPAINSLPASIAAPRPAASPQDMQVALRNVADAYHQDSRFPPYSIPLSEAHTELLQPDAAAPAQRDLSIYGLPGKLLVSVSAYRYRPGDMIEGEVKLTGNDELFTQVARVSLSLRDKTNQLIKPITANASTDAQQWLYYARFPAQKDWPEELNLTAEVFLTNGESLKQSAPFQLFEPVAEITGLGQPARRDNELIIPVQIKNAQPGFYKLGAALLYADHKPIAYVQGKGRISSSGTLELKVWGALLAQMPEKARLELGSFQLRRIPEKPGPAVGIGHSKQPFYAVGEINPADYSDLPYRNEQALQRLQFLQSLAQPSGSTGI